MRSVGFEPKQLSNKPLATNRCTSQSWTYQNRTMFAPFAPHFPESHVDVLILNAGVLPKDQTHTSEGIEKTLATHLVGHFLLTHGLLNRLRKGARSRVILVSSGGMYSQKLNVKELEHPTYLLMALLPMRVPNGVWWSSTDYGKRLYLNMASRPIACILDGPIHPAYQIRFRFLESNAKDSTECARGCRHHSMAGGL